MRVVLEKLCKALNAKDLNVGIKKIKILELKGDNRDEPVKFAIRLVRELSKMQGIEDTELIECLGRWVGDGQPQLKQLWDNSE